MNLAPFQASDYDSLIGPTLILNSLRPLRLCGKALLEKHQGKVPKNFEALNSLPGVGRKTVSVVAGNASGIPAIAVDTHVIRLSNLMGFVDLQNPEKIEERLKKSFQAKNGLNLVII